MPDGRFANGHRKMGGRPKGGCNKVSRDLRAMVLGALEGAGGQDYLIQQARENPSAFLALVGKCLPRDMRLAGEAGGPTTIQVVTGFDPDIGDPGNREGTN